MLPPQPPEGTNRGERVTFAALEHLPADWLVFHSVPWFGNRRNREGEGDFILFIPAGAAIFLEVKGPCRIDPNGNWFYRGSSRPAKDPWKQARSTGGEVWHRLKASKNVRRRPSLYLACFPDGEPQFRGGLAHEPQRSIGACDLEKGAALSDDFLRMLAREAPDGLNDPFSASELDRIRDLLLVTGQVHVPPRREFVTVAASQSVLTAEQRETYVELMSGERMLTLGGAGTGKTVLAAARAAQLGRQGISTLVVTAHGLLAQRVHYLLRENEGDNPLVRISSLTQLAADLGMGWPADDEDPLHSPEWRKAASRYPEKYEAIIIDDAHHMPASLLTTLTGLLRRPTDGSLYVFADPQQTTDKGWLDAFAAEIPIGVKVSLRRNCRNTRQICDAVARLLRGPVESNAIDGPEVEFVEVVDQPAAVEEVVRRVTKLLDSGVRPNSLAVLYDDACWYRHLSPKLAVEYDPEADGDDVNVEDEDEITLALREEIRDHIGVGSAYDLRPDPPERSDEFLEFDGGLGAERATVRRRTTLRINTTSGPVDVRCLDLESAIGLEFDAVYLLVTDDASSAFDVADVIGHDTVGGWVRVSDDEGFDAGLWLRALTGSDAARARAYVGLTRARASVSVVGRASALTIFTGGAETLEAS